MSIGVAVLRKMVRAGAMATVACGALLVPALAVAQDAGVTFGALTAREVELTARYPESVAPFVMSVSKESATPEPHRPPQYRVWPLVPGQR